MPQLDNFLLDPESQAILNSWAVNDGDLLVFKQPQENPNIIPQEQIARLKKFYSDKGKNIQVILLAGGYGFNSMSDTQLNEIDLVRKKKVEEVIDSLGDAFDEVLNTIDEWQANVKKEASSAWSMKYRVFIEDKIQQLIEMLSEKTEKIKEIHL